MGCSTGVSSTTPLVSSTGASSTAPELVSSTGASSTGCSAGVVSVQVAFISSAGCSSGTVLLTSSTLSLFS